MKPADRDYYRKLTTKSRTFTLRKDQKKWCDFYHAHFDWDGKGNEDRTQRVRHLNALFRALRRAEAELRNYALPFQLFAYVDLRDSASDALYIHTPNPNQSPFPIPIDEISFPAHVPAIIGARMDFTKYEIRRLNDKSQLVFYVVAKTRAPA